MPHQFSFGTIITNIFRWRKWGKKEMGVRSNRERNVFSVVVERKSCVGRLLSRL